MKNIIFIIAFLGSMVVLGQPKYVWTKFTYPASDTIYSRMTSGGCVILDSSFASENYAHLVDSTVYYFSHWSNNLSLPFYYLHEQGITPGSPNSNNCFFITAKYLDSTNGRFVFSWYFSQYQNYSEYSGYYNYGINNGDDSVIISNIDVPTSIIYPIQKNKTGTVTIYNSQGIFIKISLTSEYTEGLQPGTLYIYNASYSDNTISTGKFIIEN